MKTKRWMATMAAAAILAACAGNTPKSFERVVTDAEANGASYTEADWEKADERYEEFAERYDYETLSRMSEEEQREVGRLMARYVKVRLAQGMAKMTDYMEAAGNLMSGIEEELDYGRYMDEIEDALDDLEEAAADWDDLLDD